ncbi:cell division protein FtsL [Luteithermobacter gelatinilyticus]|uniref:cell division protein FtsL n=1 Tax=Luteithermobacter gelatinilyticus TaxID=2582913 RepID=UPI0011065BA9|nr:hypothetical protein [Luteithermobacter gelatinilyticus]
MIRIIAAMALLMVLVSAGAVYNLKEATERLEERKRELSRNILKDQEAIKVLKAEMAYLSRPERLQKLADRFLNLRPMENVQLAASLEDISGRDGEFELVGYPVDSFPLLLPREKPQERRANPNRRDIYLTRGQERQVHYPAPPKVQAESKSAPAQHSKSFYERILTKLEKHN